MRGGAMRKSLSVPVWATAILLVFLAFLTACGAAPVDNQTTMSTGGSQTTATTAASQDGTLVAASDLSRVSASAPRADVLSASTAMNAFGADLYAVLAK